MESRGIVSLVAVVLLLLTCTMCTGPAFHAPEQADTPPVADASTDASQSPDSQSPDKDAAADATVAAPPSCSGGLLCGSLSCCDSITVPRGTFPMGRGLTSTDACPAYLATDAGSGCSANELPEHRVTVSSFRLDTFEVTLGRFRRFVAAYPVASPAAGAGAHPLIPGSGWQSAWNANLSSTRAGLIANIACDPAYQVWTDTVGPNEKRAMNCVSWYEAFAFCAWDGGRLPTEAEWEYAAAGGGENRLYPWGSAAPDATRASYSSSAVVAVGSYDPAGNGLWGHRDMAGNVWEWTLDAYDPAWYTGNGSVCVNCANVASSDRVVRGGSFYFGPGLLRAAQRDFRVPMPGYAGEGVRCARAP